MKTGFSPVGISEDPDNTSSGSYGTPEPDAKKMLTERGNVTTQSVTSVPLACAVARKASVSEQPQAARAASDVESVSSLSASVTSSTMLDHHQARLLAKRDLARARKEAAEAGVLEFEHDDAIADLSSSRKSSNVGSPERVSRRSTPTGSVAGSPSRASDLNLENLREHEAQSSWEPNPMDLLNQQPVPMMPGHCTTIAERSQGDAPGDYPVVDEAERPCDRPFTISKWLDKNNSRKIDLP